MAPEAPMYSRNNEPQREGGKKERVHIPLEQLDADIHAALAAVPEALALYAEVDLQGRAIEAKNQAEQELARAQRIHDAISGVRERYTEKTKEQVVDMETLRMLKAVALLEETAQTHVHLRKLETDAYNQHDPAVVAMQEDILARGVANDEKYEA